jgi:formylglycine-generating enzyme required for sulfatase activity
MMLARLSPIIALAVAAVLVQAAAQELRPGAVFRDCDDCPDMVVIPPGKVLMGSTVAETQREQVPADYAARERPQVKVTLARPFALAKFEVTRGDYARFVAASPYVPPPGCATWDFPADKFAETPSASWEAPQYVAWLLRLSGRAYRLPSEAEWEYAARGGTTTARHWGDARAAACLHASVFDIASARTLKVEKGANDHFDCTDGFPYTAPVGSFPANPFGLHDMLGNASEWVMDCYNPTLDGQPTDGAARLSGNRDQRLTRGGAWSGKPWIVRAAERGRANATGRNSPLGFRVARDLP